MWIIAERFIDFCAWRSGSNLSGWGFRAFWASLMNQYHIYEAIGRGKHSVCIH